MNNTLITQTITLVAFTLPALSLVAIWQSQW